MLNHRHATRFIRQMASGGTHPCLVEAVGPDGQHTRVVIKLAEMEETFLVEALAGFVARRLGLPSPDFLVVKLSADFMNMLKASGQAHPAELVQPGLYYGTPFLADLSPWKGDRPVKPREKPFAEKVLAFDSLIANPDRTPTNNSNCFFWQGKPILLDHGAAFCSVFDQSGSFAHPWRSLRWLVGSYGHLFGALFTKARNRPKWQIVKDFAAIETTEWSDFVTSLPEEWGTQTSRTELLEYLENCRTYSDEIIAQLQVFSP